MVSRLITHLVKKTKSLTISNKKQAEATTRQPSRSGQINNKTIPRSPPFQHSPPNKEKTRPTLKQMLYSEHHFETHEKREKNTDRFIRGHRVTTTDTLLSEKFCPSPVVPPLPPPPPPYHHRLNYPTATAAAHGGQNHPHSYLFHRCGKLVEPVEGEEGAQAAVPKEAKKETDGDGQEMVLVRRDGASDTIYQTADNFSREYDDDDSGKKESTSLEMGIQNEVEEDGETEEEEGEEEGGYTDKELERDEENETDKRDDGGDDDDDDEEEEMELEDLEMET